MKKMFLLLTICMSSSILWGQVNQGTIVYERKINMHRSMAMNEQMRAMIPEFRTSRHILLFKDSISIYRLIPEDVAPDPFAGSSRGGGGTFTMVRTGSGGDGGDLFKNFSEKRSITASELAGKDYIIKDSISQQPWKLVDESRKINGYTCYKAVRKSTVQTTGGIRMSVGPGGTTTDTSAANSPKPREVDIVAWYAPDLLSPSGPDQYGLLPGTILEIDFDNGATVYSAKEIKTVVDEKQLKEPKKGKVVTAQEFNKLRMDMLQQQIQNMGGGGSLRLSNF